MHNNRITVLRKLNLKIKSLTDHIGKAQRLSDITFQLMQIFDAVPKETYLIISSFFKSIVRCFKGYLTT